MSNKYSKYKRNSTVEKRVLQKYGVGGFLKNYGLGFADTALSTIGLSNVIQDSQYEGTGANFFRKYANIAGGIGKGVSSTALNAVAPGAGTALTNTGGAFNPENELLNQQQAPYLTQGIKPQPYAYGGKMRKRYAQGGELSVTEFNGNPHEQGGIPLNNNVEVEGGEAKGILSTKDYIFSDRLKYDNDKTYADVAKGIEKKYSSRPNDPISIHSKDAELKVLMDAQEVKREKDFQRQYNKLAANYPEKMQGQQPVQQEQQMQGQPQQFAMGGNLQQHAQEYGQEHAQLMQQYIQQGMSFEQAHQAASGQVQQYAKGGIMIKPENRGKFNATKKRTGKTTEELTHSKNPITRKRAIFAQNAAKWNRQDGGFLPNTTDLYEGMYVGDIGSLETTGTPWANRNYPAATSMGNSFTSTQPFQPTIDPTADRVSTTPNTVINPAVENVRYDVNIGGPNTTVVDNLSSNPELSNPAWRVNNMPDTNQEPYRGDVLTIDEFGNEPTNTNQQAVNPNSTPNYLQPRGLTSEPLTGELPGLENRVTQPGTNPDNQTWWNKFNEEGFGYQPDYIGMGLSALPNVMSSIANRRLSNRVRYNRVAAQQVQPNLVDPTRAIQDVTTGFNAAGRGIKSTGDVGSQQSNLVTNALARARGVGNVNTDFQNINAGILNQAGQYNATSRQQANFQNAAIQQQELQDKLGLRAASAEALAKGVQNVGLVRNMDRNTYLTAIGASPENFTIGYYGPWWKKRPYRMFQDENFQDLYTGEGIVPVEKK